MSKKVVSLLFALVLGAALSFAQSTPSSSNAGQSTSNDTTTTTTTTTKKTIHHNKQAAASSSTSASDKLDINTATKEQLEALPGIGPKYSQKIIDGRPYRAKSDLVSKNIIPRSVYEKIKGDLIAHRAATTSASSKATTK